jgi:thiamine pyrophosphokinase
VVGATGRREDHTLGNLFRIFDRRCAAFTDHGAFLPVDGRCSFRTRRGAAVSVFATDPRTRMTSRGLKWPLDNVRFENLFCATLNRSTASRITLTSDHPACVFIES